MFTPKVECDEEKEEKKKRSGPKLFLSAVALSTAYGRRYG